MFALVHDDNTMKCHCISVRETIEDILEVSVEGKVRVIPFPDSIRDDSVAISQYCKDHKGVSI